MRRVGLLAAVTSLVLGTAAASAHAATLESVGTFSSPVYVTSEPQDPDRLLVVERAGRIALSEDGVASTFLDIDSLVIGGGGEQGLLSVAPAPDYASTKRFYVYYVNNGGDIQIDEFTASQVPVDTATRRPVLTIPHPGQTNHNGGQLQFGPDGHLYIATGDGGGGGDPGHNAQNLNSLLGKVLRIDPDGASPYAVPADNPFVGATGADEIWSYGLRNPFRFSFDRESGALLIGDVGQGSREEVDYEVQPNAGRGDNFGWSCREGFSAFGTTDPLCTGASGFTEPIHDYDITGANCAITGGYVVRDPGVPELAGRYVYADFCVGQLRSLVPGLPRATEDRAEGLAVASPSSFGQDSCGRVYVASLNGPVSRLAGAGPTDCTAAPADPPGGDPGGDSGGGGDAGGGTTPTPSLDTDPPLLELSARDLQRLGDDRELACRLQADEAAQATVRLALVAGDRVLARLDSQEGDLSAGADERFVWKVSRAELREVRRPLRKGKLEARFRARAVDAAGNATPQAEKRSDIG